MCGLLAIAARLELAAAQIITPRFPPSLGLRRLIFSSKSFRKSDLEFEALLRFGWPDFILHELNCPLDGPKLASHVSAVLETEEQHIPTLHGFQLSPNFRVASDV